VRNVAVASPSFSRSKLLMSELRAIEGIKVVVNDQGSRFDEDGLADFLAESRAEAAIVGLEPLTRRVLERCPQLKVVCKYGVGLDNVDEAALSARRITLGWTGGVNRRSVTELALAFALGHMRNVTSSVVKMAGGTWDKNGGRQLSDACVGIVGFGYVGTDFTRILRALGSRVLVHDILDKSKEAKAPGAEIASYDDIVRTADVISFHTPLTEQTNGMYGPKQIEQSRRGALIINTARGGIVDFEAVCAAVESGRLGGFATDVFPHEPYDASRLGKVAGLYFTPHIGGNAEEAVIAMGRSALGHLKTYLARPV